MVGRNATWSYSRSYWNWRGLIFSYIVLSGLELTTFIIPYEQIIFLAVASILLGAGAQVLQNIPTSSI